MTDEEQQDAFVGEEPKSSGGVLSAIKKAERDFDDWQATCSTIDDIYNRGGNTGGLTHILERTGWQDAKLDLFWASMEIMKPAVYARPPVPAVAPLFKDNKELNNVTADVLERSVTATLTMTNIDDVMRHVRDDVIFTNRGVIWASYESDGKSGGQKACIEYLDRMDFMHEPARTWAEVGWVARRAWMTRGDMRKRFKKHSGDAYQNAKFTTRRDDDQDEKSQTKKAGVWEVWHKADNKVYWVTEGVDVLLDSGEPHLKLSGFFPCPRPAYGTLKRRSLVPVPDWERYAVHFRKISDLTGRIYLLLDQVRMMGIVGGGGDIADAVEDMMRGNDDSVIVRVNTVSTDINSLVAWLPLNEVAQAIQGLIQARAQLIEDFYQLSGISDIMRGATESEETLGAQQLKSQYGSVRVRCKIDELQRIAADTTRIIAEIIAENFTQKRILELAQMDIPSKSDIEKRIDEVENAAKEELEALKAKAQEAAQQAQGQQIDPAQAQQAFEQAQQQIIQKYAAMLAEAEQQVPIEDIMKLLRDDQARSFTFEVETDSTILTDEMQEKQSRNEFMTQFTSSAAALMQIAAMGEEGAELAGEFMKFSLAPYRVGRQLEGVIERWTKAAPQYAAQQQGGDGEELAAANMELAKAEGVKAQAAMENVKARAAQADADNQRKIMELQQKAQDGQAKLEQENAKLMLQLQKQQQDAATKDAETQAKIDNLTAQTAKILSSIGLDERKQQLSEYTAASNEQAKRVDQAMAAEGQERDAQFRERGEERADRQQDFSEQSGERQMTLAERQALNGGDQ